jgi:hypothetical protein
MHPSNPSPEPVLFKHLAPERRDPLAVVNQAPICPVAAVDHLPSVEELEDPERWDGLS